MMKLYIVGELKFISPYLAENAAYEANDFSFKKEDATPETLKECVDYAAHVQDMERGLKIWTHQREQTRKGTKILKQCISGKLTEEEGRAALESLGFHTKQIDNYFYNNCDIVNFQGHNNYKHAGKCIKELKYLLGA